MPSKPHDRTKPSVYLDQSTLCDAFGAHAVGARPEASAYRPLLPWIERVAREANLCLSLIHFREMSKWGDLQAADALATWLDGLPIVWMRGVDNLVQQEDDVWTRRAAGAASPDVEPFAPSVLSLFEEGINPDAVGGFLANVRRGLGFLLQVMRLANKEAGTNRDLLAQYGPMAAQNIRADRARATERGWSDAQRTAQLEANLRSDLKRHAMAADARLRHARDPAYSAVALTTDEIVDRFIEQYLRDPTMLPLHRAHALHVDEFVDGAMRRTPGSSKDRDVLTGSVEDGMHLVGAVYCDVFTCDRGTSAGLGDFRTGIGHSRPQLAVGGYAGGVGAFVGDLMATWP
jgi:hypothetical protein